MLQQLGHSQTPTPIILDNSTTANFIKNNITQKRSESWDMKYFWLCDNRKNLVLYGKNHNSTLLIIILNIFQRYVIVRFTKNMFSTFLNNLFSYLASLVEGKCQYPSLFKAQTPRGSVLSFLFLFVKSSLCNTYLNLLGYLLYSNTISQIVCRPSFIGTQLVSKNK